MNPATQLGSTDISKRDIPSFPQYIGGNTAIS